MFTRFPERIDERVSFPLSKFNYLASVLDVCLQTRAHIVQHVREHNKLDTESLKHLFLYFLTATTTNIVFALLHFLKRIGLHQRRGLT